MPVKVLILEDNPVARGFLCKVVRDSFSDTQQIVEAADLEAARRHIRASADDGFKLILVDLDGYSIDEAAVLLGCAPGTVKSRCSRGRAKLAHLRRGRVRFGVGNGIAEGCVTQA